MIRNLEKRYDKVNGGNKYNINCSSLEKHTDTIEIKKIVKNKNDISILEALINTVSHTNIVNNKSKQVAETWSFAVSELLTAKRRLGRAPMRLSPGETESRTGRSLDRLRY